jgi:PKD repeat protein
MRLKISILALLLTISCAQALVISIDSGETEVSREGNLTIIYEISLNQAELTDYAIKLYNLDNEFVILNRSENIQERSGSIEYNVSNMSSGVYTLALIVDNPSLTTTETAPSLITVLQDYNLEVSVPSIVYARDNQETINALLSNRGNIDLSISAYFKNAQSDITISPQSFSLDKGTNKTLTIIINKPERNYNTTMVITSSFDSEEFRDERLIQVIVPVIELSLSSLNILSSANATMIDAVINNTGNTPVDAIVKVRTFSITEGLKTIEESINLPAGLASNYSLSIPQKTVVGFALTYQTDSGERSLSRELNFLNKIPFDFKLTTDRLLLFGGLIAILIIIAYFKFPKKKRP